MSELADTLLDLETALRELGHDGEASWVAERRARAVAAPDEVRADVRRVLAGMGSISDLPLDRELVTRVRRAVGDVTEGTGPPPMIPAEPGGPIRP